MSENITTLLRNIGPENVSRPPSSPGRLPGRGSLRVSITQRCNLQCRHCHNEGQRAPWLNESSPEPTIAEIEDLLRLAAAYAPATVKFTGGEPGVYGRLWDLLASVARWRNLFPRIDKWGLSTNGIPFLNGENYRALVASTIDNLSLGIDSLEPGEKSKPSSKFGIVGERILGLIARLRRDCPEKSLKINVVFTGHRDRVLNIVRTAYERGIAVSVIELNRVMSARPDVREDFFLLLSEVASQLGLEPRAYPLLNEVYLYGRDSNPVVRFYQDHCTDMDCGHCRAIHLRVGYSPEGWMAYPCFLQNQAHGIPLVADGALSPARFEDALQLNGRGPAWDHGTPYQRNRLVSLSGPG